MHFKVLEQKHFYMKKKLRSNNNDLKFNSNKCYTLSLQFYDKVKTNL